MKGFNQLKRVFEKRQILDTLVRRDLRIRYARSWLGYVWTLIDPLAMPAGAVPGAGKQIFDIVRWIREELGCNCTCGASNISFGLPNRAAVNASFVAMAIAAGMTLPPKAHRRSTSDVTKPINDATQRTRTTPRCIDPQRGHVAGDERASFW